MGFAIRTISINKSKVAWYGKYAAPKMFKAENSIHFVCKNNDSFTDIPMISISTFWIECVYHRRRSNFVRLHLLNTLFNCCTSRACAWQYFMYLFLMSRAHCQISPYLIFAIQTFFPFICLSIERQRKCDRLL